MALREETKLVKRMEVFLWQMIMKALKRKYLI